MRVELTVNGTNHVVDDVWSLASLLDLLREGVGLRGTKGACEQGECGSCSVYLNDVLVCSCLVAAGQASGAEVVTIEGLATDAGTLHPIQQSLLDCGGVQCGFCTPGMVMAAHALVRNDPDPTELTIREELSGNLCRCTGYQKIVEAVQVAAARFRSAQ